LVEGSGEASRAVSGQAGEAERGLWWEWIEACGEGGVRDGCLEGVWLVSAPLGVGWYDESWDILTSDSPADQRRSMSVNVRGKARTWREVVRKRSLKAVVRKCMVVVGGWLVGWLIFDSFLAIAVVGRYFWMATSSDEDGTRLSKANVYRTKPS
jgi:hypothetical protein